MMKIFKTYSQPPEVTGNKNAKIIHILFVHRLFPGWNYHMSY